MKKLQTLCASMLFILVLSATAFADCPNGGIMGTGGVCTNGIMGTGGTAIKSSSQLASEPKAPDADVFELLLAAELAIWQSIIGLS